MVKKISVVILTLLFSFGFVFADSNYWSNAEKIGGFFVKEMELNPAVAFGILGNIDAESGCRPEAVEGNGEGHGLCQWSFGRKKKLKDFAASKGKDWKDLDIQLLFLKDELNGPYKKIYDKLKKLPNNKEGMEQACRIWMLEFERPANQSEKAQKGRISRAEKIYDHFGGKLNGYSVGAGGYVQDYDILSEAISPVTSISYTDGSVFTTTKTDKEHREEINAEILKSTVKGKSTNNKTYSLYDRFGPKLQFVDYYGERESQIQLFDHIVSYGMQDKLTELELKDLKYESTHYLSSEVYKNRPRVLTSEQVKSGFQDPRVTAFETNSLGQRIVLVHANILLSIASTITSFVTFLSGTKFLVFIKDTFDYIATTSFWTVVLKESVLYIMLLATSFFIFSLVRYALGYAKGNSSALGFIKRFLVGALSLGLIYAMIASPLKVNKIIYNITTSIDQLFDESLNMTKLNNPVVSSSDTTNVKEATIWETTLFKPWVEGTFNADYDDLYTQYSDKSEKHKMKQSYTPKHDAKGLKEPFYDSATLTGDIQVDRGGGKVEKNWAAFAYSTLSKYHIGQEYYDRTKDTGEKVKKDTDGKEENSTLFPQAMTTANDKNLYADTFRWIDAKMNISPQYMLNDEKVDSYNDSNQFETHYYKAGWKMLINSLLLLCLLPVLIARLRAFLRLMMTVVKIIIYALKELFADGSGIPVVWSDFKEDFLEYLFRSIQLNILIILYSILVGANSILASIVFVILSFVMTNTTPRDILETVRGAGNQVKRFV